MAAFQHEKEPNELNVSLDDFHSKRNAASKSFHAQLHSLQRPDI